MTTSFAIVYALGGEQFMLTRSRRGVLFGLFIVAFSRKVIR